MKKTIMLILAAISLSVAANAQQTLPYYTGFDNATEKAGWQSFREGTTNGSLDWNYAADYNLFTPASAPDCIQHDYPEVGAALTDDWFVSPALDFSTGAKIALKVNIYCISGTPNPGDTVEVYLLNGNADPAQASTVTLLANLTNLTDGNYDWKDTAGIAVPATTGNTYIAFRYTADLDWFQAGIDDIEITADSTAPPPPSGIQNIKSDIAHLEVYPNPATTTISWNFTGHKEQDKLLKGEILDVQGKVLLTFPAMTKQLDIHTLSPGLYYLKIENGMKTFVKK